MDKASASGAGDCGFESHLGRTEISFGGEEGGTMNKEVDFAVVISLLSSDFEIDCNK